MCHKKLIENGVESTCVDISYKELLSWSFIEATHLWLFLMRVLSVQLNAIDYLSILRVNVRRSRAFFSMCSHSNFQGVIVTPLMVLI